MLLVYTKYSEFEWIARLIFLLLDVSNIFSSFIGIYVCIYIYIYVF